jgi:hypothetical protein
MAIVSANVNLDDAEFAQACATTERLGKEHPLVRVYVVAGKGTPSPDARKIANDLGKKVKIRCATMAKYLVTRAVVNIFSLFMDIKAFKQNDLDRGADFLQATPEEREWLRQTVDRLQREIDAGAA